MILPSKKGPIALIAMCMLLAVLPHPVAADEAKADLELVPAGVTRLRFEDTTRPIAYLPLEIGPIFALHPLVELLGGELVVGPMGKSHRLVLGGREYLFGPGSPALTAGEEIAILSQPPVASDRGLLVPLDLLRRTYTELLGWDLAWDPEQGTLVASRRPPRQIPAVVDLVHLQGVSTLVFQFDIRPRYTIAKSQERIEISLVGDILDIDTSRSLAADPLVTGLELGSRMVRVRLAPGAIADEYTLDDPFRLVFDIHRGTRDPEGLPSTIVSPLQPPAPPRRASGISTIVLDPGHGGDDTGAHGQKGSLEKEFTLLLARSLRAALVGRLPVRVTLTRETDVNLPLENRTALANQQKADLFISLHINSSPDRNAHGAETYFSSLEASDERAARAAAAENLSGVEPDGAGDPLYDLRLILWDLAQSHHLAESQRFASLIQDELNMALGLRNRGVKQAPFTVLLGAAMPAVLVELGFLSNPAEEDRLQSPEYRNQLVEALTRAVIRYKAQAENRAPVSPQTQP